MTINELNELRGKLEISTQGDWKADHQHSGEFVFSNQDVVCFPQEYKDAVWIASTHNAMEDLLDLAEWALCVNWLYDTADNWMDVIDLSNNQDELIEKFRQQQK